MGHVDSPAMISGWHTSYKGYISFPHENSTFYHFSKILLIENKNKNNQLSKITMDGYLIHWVDGWNVDQDGKTTGIRWLWLQ